MKKIMKIRKKRKWRPQHTVQLGPLTWIRNRICNMEILSVVSTKNSVNKIALPSDIWKIIFGFLNDESCGCGFGSILPYRAISKVFSILVLECIREVQISFDLGSISSSSLIRQRSDVICGCKGLRRLSYWTCSFVFPEKHFVECFIKGLEKIGNACENIEELHLKAPYTLFTSSENLPLFRNLRKLFLRNFNIAPPSNMHNWIHLSCVEGNILGDLWTRALSTLPNLKEIHFLNTISNQDFIDFCNYCKDKSICNTLEVLDLFSKAAITDDGLYLLLDTFPELTTVIIVNTVITLATANIAQKLGSLRNLKMLIINDSKIFFNANVDLIYEWLEISLPYFPKSLEIIKIMNCEVSIENHPLNNDMNLLDFSNLKSKIVSRFYDFLPNLREINITFDYVDGYPD